LHVHAARAPVSAPGGKPLGELLRKILDPAQVGHEPPPQQIRRARIVQLHSSMGIHDQHPVLHVADDQFVDAKLVGEVGTALLREALVQYQAARQPIGDQRRREITDRQEPGLDVVGGAGVLHEHPVRLLEKDGNRGQCGVEERQCAPTHQRSARQRNEQHHAQAAADAARGIHQDDDEHDVGDDVQRELKVEVRRHLSQHDVKYDGERQIYDARVRIDHGAVVAEVEGVTENQGGEQEYRRHRDAVEVEVLERDPERVRYGPLLREQRQAEHR